MHFDQVNLVFTLALLHSEYYLPQFLLLCHFFLMYYLEKIDDESFAVADKYSLKGDLLLRMRKRDEAIHAYGKALEINFARNEIRVKLIRLLGSYNRSLAREEIENQKYVQSFFPSG